MIEQVNIFKIYVGIFWVPIKVGVGVGVGVHPIKVGVGVGARSVGGNR